MLKKVQVSILQKYKNKVYARIQKKLNVYPEYGDFDLVNKDDIVYSCRMNYAKNEKYCNKENYEKNKKYCEKTILNMTYFNRPVIAEGVFHFMSDIFESVDLIVRSDYINILFGQQILTQSQMSVKAPNVPMFHYYAVTLQLFSGMDKYREYNLKKGNNTNDVNDEIYLPTYFQFTQDKQDMLLYIYGEDRLIHYHKYRSEILNKHIGEIQDYDPTQLFVLDQYKIC